MGLELHNLSENIELNLKTKETALYYILAKKLRKENVKIPSYFCCESFDPFLI
jgi:hypothetical protein